MFIQPESSDLPAGKLVKLLVGFQNNGTSSFIVDKIDGAFRYPQDFSYYIQNVSLLNYKWVIINLNIILLFFFLIVLSIWVQ